MERAQLAAARKRKHWTLAEVAQQLGVDTASVQRWEKGTATPQPLNLRKLEALFQMTARELGFYEPLLVTLDNQAEPASPEDALTAFRSQSLYSRVLRIVCHCARATRAHDLQHRLLVELEEAPIMHELSRRDVLYFLASLPLDLSGLTRRGASFLSAPNEIVTQCAAGITACWQLRKGADLAFADQTVSAYLPTLKAIVQTAPSPHREEAADVLVQCLLLKATLAWNIATPQDAIAWAQQANTYSELADTPLFRVIALRTLAATYWYANRWTEALRTAEQAKYVLEQQRTAVPGRPAAPPVPRLVSSYVYAGLATYQSHEGHKEDALRSLQQAHRAFFERPADETAPVWVDHSVGNLLLNDGSTHAHLGLYGRAVGSLAQIEQQYGQDASVPLSCRVEAMIDQVTAEASRDDRPRDLDLCIALLTQSVEGVKTIKSEKKLNDVLQAYRIMRAAWPHEQRVKVLRELIVHW